MDEPSFFISLGPIAFLRVGRVWSLDLTATFGIYGVGRHWRFRRIAR